ncbi:glutaredoxin 3 [Parvibaculum sedimenti]|uniref:Glutaredoxin n=1 Tax=Parvibaculum sedimenti TaxID=2608632 RepID=A0A6N6VDB1_9HYPH|nr:glutaredoxin 3 [Parvibaculum sedimenti]KAB7738695.1 glutaredoxin 3 [Parvibaculum sedimenti]
MAEVTIYTTMTCPYCMRAKALLGKKGVKFHEIDVSGNAARRDEMTARAGGRYTVPQIFIGETHVGGCDDLYALEGAGKLDPLLAA